jgi:hypothetical protein
MPRPESTDAVYTSNPDAKEEHFFKKNLGPDEVIMLTNPNQIMRDNVFLQRLGLLLTPYTSASRSPYVVETYHVCHHLGRKDETVMNGLVVYKSPVMGGFYICLGYVPTGYRNRDGKAPIFETNPINISSGCTLKMGSTAEKKYLESVRGVPEYHKVPNGFG